MKHSGFSKYKFSLTTAALFLLLAAGPAFADSVDTAEDVPATAAETQFINRVVDQVKAAVPPIDGWNLDVGITVSGNTMHEGKPVLIYERARNLPLKINMQFDFREITAAQEKRASEEKSAQQLQEEMMNAAMSGDTEKTQQLQQQLAAMMQAQMTAGPMGQGAGVTPMAPAEKPKQFYVQVVVNGDGEDIGKQYDMPSPPGVTHAFRVDKGSGDFLSYKYYMGAWKIGEADGKNWNVSFPKNIQTSGNHLRALVLSANVYGDRKNVEEYVKGLLSLNKLKGALN